MKVSVNGAMKTPSAASVDTILWRKIQLSEQTNTSPLLNAVSSDAHELFSISRGRGYNYFVIGICVLVLTISGTLGACEEQRSVP